MARMMRAAARVGVAVHPASQLRLLCRVHCSRNRASIDALCWVHVRVSNCSANRYTYDVPSGFARLLLCSWSPPIAGTPSAAVCAHKSPKISPCVTLLCCAPPFSSPQALRPSVKSAIAAASSAAADVQLAPGDILTVGSLQLLCLATPGHTNGCMCFYLPGNGSRTGMVFTGELRKNGGRGRPGRGRWVRCKGVGV